MPHFSATTASDSTTHRKQPPYSTFNYRFTFSSPASFTNNQARTVLSRRCETSNSGEPGTRPVDAEHVTAALSHIEQNRFTAPRGRRKTSHYPTRKLPPPSPIQVSPPPTPSQGGPADNAYAEHLHTNNVSHHHPNIRACPTRGDSLYCQRHMR